MNTLLAVTELLYFSAKLLVPLHRIVVLILDHLKLKAFLDVKLGRFELMVNLIEVFLQTTVLVLKQVVFTLPSTLLSSLDRFIRPMSTFFQRIHNNGLSIARVVDGVYSPRALKPAL